MAFNLSTEVRSIARKIGRSVGKFALVWPSAAATPPVVRPGTSHVRLNVAEPEGGADFDPSEHLSDEQRAEIGPADRVIVVQHVAEGPADGR